MMSVVSKYMAQFNVEPDYTVDLRDVPPANDTKDSTHRHIVVILDDDSELWLDLATHHKDHNHADIRWMNPAGEMKGTGVFTIVNGQRMSLSPYSETRGVEDTAGRVVKGHGWLGGYVTTLLVDKNGKEETAIVPSDGNG